MEPPLRVHSRAMERAVAPPPLIFSVLPLGTIPSDSHASKNPEPSVFPTVMRPSFRAIWLIDSEIGLWSPCHFESSYLSGAVQESQISPSRVARCLSNSSTESTSITNLDGSCIPTARPITSKSIGVTECWTGEPATPHALGTLIRPSKKTYPMKVSSEDGLRSGDGIRS